MVTDDFSFCLVTFSIDPDSKTDKPRITEVI
jgi:hypothetical protein